MTAVFDSGARILALHRPGQRVGDAAGEDRRERAYAKFVEDSTNAWRSPERAAADAERDRLIARDQSLADSWEVRTRAWERMCAEACEAWKRP